MTSVALFIDPASYHFENDRLFDLRTSRLGGADVLAPYIYLREWMADRGVTVRTADALERGEGLAERNVYVSLGIRHRYPQIAEQGVAAMSAFFGMECPIVEPKLYRDLDDVACVCKRVFSFASPDALRPFLRAPVPVRGFRIPQSFDRVHDDIWANEDRGFLTIINGNKVPRLQTNELYTERMRAVAYFERHGEVDLYGIGWDVPPYRMGETWVPNTAMRGLRACQGAWHRVRTPPLLAAARRAYRGAVNDKARTLGRYQFAICFENMILEGWITEKLFDCLYSGAVPVYLGAPDIERWVPPECFVDMRRFADYGELRDFLRCLSPSDIAVYREAARDFVGSERFRPFSRDSFARLIGGLVEEDAGVVLEPEVERPVRIEAD